MTTKANLITAGACLGSILGSSTTAAWVVVRAVYRWLRLSGLIFLVLVGMPAAFTRLGAPMDTVTVDHLSYMVSVSAGTAWIFRMLWSAFHPSDQDEAHGPVFWFKWSRNHLNRFCPR